MIAYVISHQALPVGMIDVDGAKIFFSNVQIKTFITRLARKDKAVLDAEYIAKLHIRLSGSWTVGIMTEEDRALL